MEIKPRLRIFLSVDMVGSTALKQRRIVNPDTINNSVKADPDQEAKDGLVDWLVPILSFYHEWPKNFHYVWDKIPDKGNIQEPYLWTTVGDELIFIAELGNCKHAHLCIQAWIETARITRISVKMSAWLAGFPVINKEVISHSPNSKTWDSFCQNLELIEKLNEKDYSELTKEMRHVEFFGPAIDTGFRISKLSTERKLPISIDLAYLLAKVNKDIKRDKIHIHYEGRHELKGVLDGRSYPFFWVDCDRKDLGILEDKLQRKKPAEYKDVISFVEKFVAEIANERICIIPYIRTCVCCATKQPELHKSYLAVLMGHAELTRTQMEQFEASQNQPLPPTQNEADNSEILMLDIAELKKSGA